MSVYENLERLGLSIHSGLEPGGIYTPVNQTGNLVFISGQGSIENG